MNLAQHITIALALFTAFPYIASAAVQRDSVIVVGTVRHSLTQQKLAGVTLRVENPIDSSLVTATYTDDVRILMGLIPKGSEINEETVMYRFKVPQTGKYIIQARLLGFQPKYIELEIPKNAKEWNAPDIFLKEDTHMLGEATVTASKLMMVMRGDTVVYNADAFQLAEGSMLDKLFQLMPGFEIKPGGAIYVNGRYVESLLLNGKDFFNGNPSIALENLPSYTVKEVKVFERAEKSAYLNGNTGKKEEENPLAVDVVLKKEYAQGWMANAEGGYGTDKVYNIRAFVMRYTDQSRLTLYGNVNNVNLAVSPTEDGDWNGDDYVTAGRTEREAGGLDFFLTDRRTQTELNTSLNASREDNDLCEETSSTTFLPSSASYLRQRNETDGHSTNWQWSNKLTYPGKAFYLRFDSEVSYNKAKSSSTLRSAQFTAEPYECSRLSSLDSIFTSPSQTLQNILTNHYEQAALTHSEKWKAGGTIFTKFNGAATLYNPMGVTLSGHYKHDACSTFALSDLQYTGGTGNDYRHTYDHAPHTAYDLQADWTYAWKRGLVRYSVGYTYKREYDKATRGFFRLDRLAQSEGNASIGVLPSEWMSLQQTALDASNSYTAVRSLNSHEAFLQMLIGDEKMGYFNLNIPFRWTSESYSDVRPQREEQRISRQLILFSPSVEYSYGQVATSKGRYKVRYSLGNEAPGADLLIDADDTTNPLYIRKGNAGLKNTKKHAVIADYMRQSEAGYTYIFFDYHLYENAVAQELTYDSSTGISTYKPRNVDGNWSVKGEADIQRVLNRSKQWSFYAETSVAYANNADYISLDGTDAVRSSVRNLQADELASFTFRKTKCYVSFEEGISYNYAASTRKGFQTRHTFDFRIGANFNVDLPWRLVLNTSLFLYSRCGYDDSSMNDNNLVWNASLSRPLDRLARWTLRLRGNDILHQLSTVRRTLNAQCLTETRTNSLPSFFMLSLSYKLHVLPKKRTK